MSEALIQRKRSEREQEIVLRLLEHVADDEALSQAKFASQIGIAKGLANSYFNRCLQKGWIKLRQVPRARYLYYLTPKGFAEKARLTAQFLSYSYQFYRDARSDLVAAMAQAAADGHRRISVLGDGELAEIAAVVSGESPIEVIGFLNGGSKRKRIAGYPVAADLSELDGTEAVLLATLDETKAVYDAFRDRHPDIEVYVPGQLGPLVWDGTE
jgi:DNA-binding MarR family transcriptional regulator